MPDVRGIPSLTAEAVPAVKTVALAWSYTKVESGGLMEGIGIIGYAAPSPTGIIVREFREKLGITEQFAIYDYSAGGFDNKWAEGVFAGGFPRSGNFADRWDWEIRRDELDDWIQDRRIKKVLLVGNTFGENTVKWIGDWNLPHHFVDVGEDNAVALNGLRMPWPIATEEDKAKWEEAVRG